MSETRKIAAILAADVVGFSRLAGADEDRTLARLRALLSDLIDPTVSVHRGRVVKRTGDGLLVEFRSVVDAVRCAIEVQNAMVERNAGLPPERRIDFRIGIHLGDVVEGSDSDLMGDGVNIAARLEGIAEPNGICLSNAAYEQVRDKVKERFADLGEQVLKNIARPVRVYSLASSEIEPPTTPLAETPEPPGDHPSIAVLPFACFSEEREFKFLTEAMTEDLTRCRNPRSDPDRCSRSMPSSGHAHPLDADTPRDRPAPHSSPSGTPRERLLLSRGNHRLSGHVGRKPGHPVGIRIIYLMEPQQPLLAAPG
jgi:adenylate cyclase